MTSKPPDQPYALDTRLSALVDDELPLEERDELEAWLARHPADAARVRAWRQDREALRQLFGAGGLMAEPPGPPPVAMAELVMGRRYAANLATYAPQAAAAALLLGLGILLGNLLHPLPFGAAGQYAQGRPAEAVEPVPWPARAAVAHAVFTPERRHPVDVQVAGAPSVIALQQEQHLVHWLSQRLALPVKVFDLRQQGYELVGGRLLPDGMGQSAQLMYQLIGTDAASPAAGRITVYLRRPDNQAEAAFRYARQGELGVFYWVEGVGPGQASPVGYALVGTLPKEKLLELAQVIYAQDRRAGR